MTTTRATRVQRGIKLLDEQRPNWCDKINLQRLDLHSPYLCVLGQVFGTVKQGKMPTARLASSGVPGFDKGKDILNLTHPETVSYGFNTENEQAFQRLTKTWVEAILEHCPEVKQ